MPQRTLRGMPILQIASAWSRSIWDLAFSGACLGETEPRTKRRGENTKSDQCAICLGSFRESRNSRREDVNECGEVATEGQAADVR